MASYARKLTSDIVAYFDKNDKAYMHQQMESVLGLSCNFECQLQGHGSLSDHVEQLQLTLANKKSSLRCILETYEQELADSRIQATEYVQNDPKSTIRLTKRADLKNRLLIKQLRDVCACRQILNHVRDTFKIAVEPLDDKFISHLRRVFDLLT